MTDVEPITHADPLVGRVVGDQYRILRPLAAGGMGRVYLAEQLRLGRPVAVKVLGADFARPPDPAFRERFYQEARLCSRLTHPNTVRIFDFGGSDAEGYFIAMEYVEGRELGEILHDTGTLEPLEA